MDLKNVIRKKDHIRYNNLYNVDIKAGTAKDIEAVLSNMNERMSLDDTISYVLHSLLETYTSRYGSGDGMEEQLRRKGINTMNDLKDQIYWYINKHAEKLVNVDF